MSENYKFSVGVDEAGRGPLAGPVAVGVAVVPADFNWGVLPGVTDSKQLSAKKRAAVFETAKTLQKAKQLDYTVSLVSAAVIDKIGITKAISLALERALRRLKTDPKTCQIKLDGGLKAPVQYQQETIIKGDQKEKVIGLASICAKEARDAYMVRIADEPQFAPYDFAKHKGYGTKAHREMIKLNGISTEHRLSYCKNCLN